MELKMELIAKVKKVEFKLKDSRYSSDPEYTGEIELNNKVYNIYPKLRYEGDREENTGIGSNQVMVGSYIYYWDLQIQELDTKSIEALGIEVNFDEVYTELNKLKIEADAEEKRIREEKKRLIYEAHPIVVYFKDNQTFELFGETNPEARRTEEYQGKTLRASIEYERGKYVVSCNDYGIKHRRVSTPEKAILKAEELLVKMKQDIDHKLNVQKAKIENENKLIADAKELFGLDIYEKYDRFYFRGKGNGIVREYERDGEGSYSTVEKDKEFTISRYNEDWTINGLTLGVEKAKKVMQILLDENS